MKKHLLLLAIVGATLFLTYGMNRFGGDMIQQGMGWIGAVSIVGLALPTMLGWWWWQGGRGFALILVLSVYALCFESIAVATGVPYGWFEYASAFGGKVLGLVPWTVPFAWMPVALGSWVVAERLAPDRRWLRVVLAAVLLVVYDLVLDPGAVSQGYWTWHFPGWYYQIPVSNYLGWFVSGLGGAALIEAVVVRKPLQSTDRRLILCATFASLLLWTGVAFWQEMWLPVVVGILYGWYVYYGRADSR